jgi:hypothetical protein
MRYGLVSAAFIIAISFTAVSSTSVHAEQYCGFVNKRGAIVKCGYSSRESCENAIGQGAICFVRPDVGLGETPLRQPGLKREPA